VPITPHPPPITDGAINDFAIRSFRNIADGDYIAARMACRAVLLPQFLWGSQQAIEKYLKCILLLNRIPARKVFHDLAAALREVNNSGKLALDVTEPTRKFIERIDDMGRFGLCRSTGRCGSCAGSARLHPVLEPPSW
jgi:hypothetical protein